MDAKPQRVIMEVNAISDTPYDMLVDVSTPREKANDEECTGGITNQPKGNNGNAEIQINSLESGGDNAKLTFKKLRRKHKNSKNGCADCKARKLKCDEKLPICSFCSKRGIQCSYLTMTPFQIHQIQISHYEQSKMRKRQTGEFAERDHEAENDNEADESEEEEEEEEEEEDEEEEDKISKHIDDSPLYAVNNPRKNEYIYAPTRQINLRNDQLLNYNAHRNIVYQAHELEGIVLPPSIGVEIPYNESINIGNYIPLTTFKSNEQLEIINDFEMNFSIPLGGTSRVVNKTFNINRNKEIEILNEEYEKLELINDCILKGDLTRLALKYNRKDVYQFIIGSRIQIMAILQIFCKLLRNSIKLLSIDYFKNIIMKQDILPLVKYKEKISISSALENSSVVLIDLITRIIKEEYLPEYDDFLEARLSLLSSSFFVLNLCLAFHFKNGLKFNINYDEGKKNVKLIGIFSTGMYSVIMDKTKTDLRLSGSNVLSKFLTLDFKYLLLRNYNHDNLDEIKRMLERLNSKYLNNVDYENLKIFLHKHCKLIRDNYRNDTIMNYDVGYMLRILNEFQSIIPRDICNLNYEVHDGRLNDEKIVIYLFYVVTSEILQVTIPSINAFSSNGFYGNGWFMFNFNREGLMKTFKKIQNREFQIIGLTLVRICAFFSNRTEIVQRYLKSMTLESIFGNGDGSGEEEEVNVEEKYHALRKARDECPITEMNVKSFILEKGQFIREWNYPNMENLKPKRWFKVAQNKLIHEKSVDMLLTDFSQNGSGFFSLDYDPNDMNRKTGAEKPQPQVEVEFDGFAIKTMWKLLVYMRMNNL